MEYKYINTQINLLPYDIVLGRKMLQTCRKYNIINYF